MPEYKCHRCNKVFKMKIDYQRHMDKKFPCHNCVQKDNNQIIVDALNGLTFKCSICSTIFTRKSSLKRHQLKGCTKIDENDELKKKIKELEDSLQKLKDDKGAPKGNTIVSCDNNTNSNNVITSNNTQHVYNDVKIIAFGEEDMYSLLTDEQAIKYIKKGYQSVYNLIKDMNFDPLYPERHNAYITNLSSKYALKYDGDDWVKVPQDELVGQMFDDKLFYLTEMYRELKTKIDSKSRDKFWRLETEHKNSDEIKNLKEEIRLLMYNSRKIPMKTRKMVEKEERKRLKELDE